ncbi:hypothetical protein [Sphingobacterium faecium]|uniref:hypothetical protein n=1 Tax=Sphingobacterium faecium TaxID=34087 RepID=UPI003207AF4F
MDLFLNFLNHFWAVLGVLVTIYCYLVVRQSKFVVVYEKLERVINKNNGIDLRANTVKLNSNLSYYKLVICYTGLKDVKENDVKIPFSIINSDKNCKWHNIKILKCSSTFKPKISLKENRFIIQNSLIKRGDSLMLEFYLDTTNDALNFTNRILDVDTVSSVYKFNHKSYLPAILVSFGFLLILSYALNSLIENFYKNKELLGEYNIEYFYRDQHIRRNWEFQESYAADSIFDEDYFFKHAPSTYFRTHIPDTASLKSRAHMISEMKQLRKISNDFKNKVDEHKPSARAKNMYDVLKHKGTLKMNTFYQLDNSFKIRFRDPSEFNWGINGFVITTIIIISISICLVVFMLAYFSIHYFSIKSAYRYLK